MRTSILKTFGKNVSKYRKLKHLSQEQLGKKANLHRTYIGSIERSERNASLINIEKIANALEVRIEDLLS